VKGGGRGARVEGGGGGGGGGAWGRKAGGSGSVNKGETRGKRDRLGRGGGKRGEGR